MTSAQLMPSGIALVALFWLAACQRGLTQPTVLTNPRPETELWAVVPFANESGVSIVDGARVADLFTQQLQHVEGINTVPVNRVLLAMRHAGMSWVATPDEAVELAGILGVDAIVVGTVTAYDPYPPPTLGMAVQVFASGTARSRSEPDLQELSRAARGGEASPGDIGPMHATAQAAGVFEARSHATLQSLQDFAAGRTEPDEAFGVEVYLNDMELYTQFVSYRLIDELLASERARLQPVEVATQR